MQLVALSLKMHELALTLAAIQEASIRGDRAASRDPLHRGQERKPEMSNKCRCVTGRFPGSWRSYPEAPCVRWASLPPLSFSCARVSVAAALEPALEGSGDAFDYALNGDVLHVGIFDGMGHDLASSLLTGPGRCGLLPCAPSRCVGRRDVRRD